MPGTGEGFYLIGLVRQSNCLWRPIQVWCENLQENQAMMKMQNRRLFYKRECSSYTIFGKYQKDRILLWGWSVTDKRTIQICKQPPHFGISHKLLILQLIIHINEESNGIFTNILSYRNYGDLFKKNNYICVRYRELSIDNARRWGS